MKKFSEFKKIYEDENTQGEETVKANLPENTEPESEETKPNLPEQTEEKSDSPKSFFSKLFESREMAHIYHLQVKGDPGSYAKHMALGDYYEKVLDFIDDLIETWQGQYGLIEEYDIIDTKETSSKDALDYMKELAQYIKDNKKVFSPDDTHLLNIVDEVVALIYKTIYKLIFNK